MGKLENYDIINELMNLVFNTNIVCYPSIGLVLLFYYIAEYSTSIILVLHCMQKASIAHHWLSHPLQLSSNSCRQIVQEPTKVHSYTA